MSAAGPPVHAPTAVRSLVSALDHGLAGLGYTGVPETRLPGGGWRRLYLKGDGPTLAAVGGPDGAWASLGVEVRAPRRVVVARSAALLTAMAPYEVAVDPDAGGDRDDPDAVVRVALRLFLDGCGVSVVREAAGNVVAAASAATTLLS